MSVWRPDVFGLLGGAHLCGHARRSRGRRRRVQRAPSSATSSGVAAEMRAAQKVGKYGALAAQVSSSFHPAVIERYGACCEALWGFLRTAAGDRDRDPLRHDDVTFSHSSRGTYAAGMLVFAAVIGDAALIAEVIDVDTHGRDPRAVPVVRPVAA